MEERNKGVWENCAVNILPDGGTLGEFISDKIKELSSKDEDGPFLVANLDALFEKHLKWLISLPRVKPFYAVKCNNTPAVLRILSALGTGFDCASKFSEVINAALDEFFPPDRGVKIIAEPGRYFVESVFTLAAAFFAKRVIDDVDEDSDSKEGNSGRKMMYYLKDGVYGSLSCILNDAAELKPYLHRAVGSSEPRFQSVIWGPTCDCIDKVAENYWIPELHIGDWLLIDNMGAYTLTLCTDFNGFERAQIYPVVSAKTLQFMSLHSYT